MQSSTPITSLGWSLLWYAVLCSTREALDLILVAAEKSGHKNHLRLGLDASARHLYSAGMAQRTRSSMFTRAVCRFLG